MAGVSKIYQWNLEWEGGLVYIPSEGQWTNKGVQEKTFYALSQSLLGVAPTLANLKALTDAQAKKFIDYFWNIATYGNRINNQQSANLMFFALWASWTTGIEKMQMGLRAVNKDIIIDGVVGPQTVATINKGNPQTINNLLTTALAEWFRQLGQSPQYAKSEKGWLARLASLEKLTPTSPASGNTSVAGLALLGLGLVLIRSRAA